MCSVFAFSLFIGGEVFVSAEDSAPTEYEVKAAFLFNFSKFVEWPEDALQKDPSSFVLGIVGEDPFGKDLDRVLQGKTVQDRKLVVRHISTAEEAAACQVLFISTSRPGRVKPILAAVRHLPVLTVGDYAGFIQQGGIIGFEMEQRNVRFNINETAAADANLKISSQILKLAKTVVRRDAEAPNANGPL